MLRIYDRTNEKKVATQIGIYSRDIQLDETITQDELIATIQELNNDTKQIIFHLF